MIIFSRLFDTQPSHYLILKLISHYYLILKLVSHYNWYSNSSLIIIWYLNSSLIIIWYSNSSFTYWMLKNPELRVFINIFGEDRFWIQGAETQWTLCVQKICVLCRQAWSCIWRLLLKCCQMASRIVGWVLGYLRGRRQDTKTRMRPGVEREINNARCCWRVHATARFEHRGNLQPAGVSQRGPRIETHDLTARRAQVGRRRLESGESLIC